VRRAAEVVIVCAGGALLACAIVLDQRWLDRHFLPSFYWSRQWCVAVAFGARAATAVLALAVAVPARARIARHLAGAPGPVLATTLAAVLAVGASEWALRRVHLRAREEQPEDQEPCRRADPWLGWRFVPARAGHQTVGGRVIEYAFDAAGYRVHHPGEAVDPERPAVLFTGESIMVGHGLTWSESVPAQVEALLGIQSANMAVHGFASDQAYLRLQAELPRFRRPMAAVALFMPGLFNRNLDDDRPHMGPGLVWLPSEPRWRLVAIAGLLVPYRREETIELGVRVTREVLCATVELARARGAVPLIVVPQFGPEEPGERALRRRLLDEPGLPYVWVEIDPSWRMRGNLHPDARAAHAIALAVAGRLKETLEGSGRR
jgi:hypothetical protein